MKRIYVLTLFTLFSVAPFFGQELFTCYDEYRKVFENRGASELTNGVHDNIIMSIRDADGNTECYVVTVTVKVLDIVEIAVYFDDDTKEVKKYEFVDQGSWTVHNGVSKTRVTTDDQKINIMFTDLIKPKRKELKKAPKPKFDLN